MAAQTFNCKGYVNSIKINPDEYLLPLFEVIINAIQSIEDKENSGDGVISIKAVRSSQAVIETESEPHYTPIVGFEVCDNGVGFTGERFAAFNDAFTDFNAQKGCKGIGRYTVLACFGSMEINSNFSEAGNWYNRSFRFDNAKGIGSEKDENKTQSDKQELKTKVSLNNYKKHFQKYINDSRIELNDVASDIIQHCLLYFIAKSMPRIELYDESTGKSPIVLNDIFCNVIKFDREPTQLQMKNVDSVFNLNYLRNYSDKVHSFHLCANKREVGKKKSIAGFIPSFVKNLTDEQQRKYYLSVYITSEFLDAKANNQRNEFMLPEKAENKNYFDEICLAELFDGFSNNVRQTYSGFIETADKEKNDRIRNYILDEKNPRLTYKHLLMDLMVRRKSVIKLFNQYLEWRADENYMLEEDLHNIIFTMGAETDTMPVDYHNLWLLDERFVFYRRTSSDKQLRTIKDINADSQKEPDLLIYDFPWAYSDNPNKVNSLVVFEFKRPGRDMNTAKDRKLDAQVEEYFEKLMQSKAKSDKGVLLNIEDNTAKFGYVLCEVDKDLEAYNIKHNYFKKTPHNTLYKINPELNMYIEVMSYRTMIDFAEKRHNAFFQALGIENL
jgi:hypothetical protein